MHTGSNPWQRHVNSKEPRSWNQQGFPSLFDTHHHLALLEKDNLFISYDLTKAQSIPMKFRWGIKSANFSFNSPSYWREQNVEKVVSLYIEIPRFLYIADGDRGKEIAPWKGWKTHCWASLLTWQYCCPGSSLSGLVECLAGIYGWAVCVCVPLSRLLPSYRGLHAHIVQYNFTWALSLPIVFFFLSWVVFSLGWYTHALKD